MSFQTDYLSVLVQELIGTVCSNGVARTSLMLGHSMGILRLYEILRKVQKHLGGLGHVLSAYAVSL